MITVLVVDDDFMVANIHERFVARTDGFEVVGSARTGAEALALASERWIERPFRRPRTAQIVAVRSEPSGVPV